MPDLVHHLPLTVLATLVALVVYFLMGLSVGQARTRFSVPAPATTGSPDFERRFRVHMNTLEWMPLFLPTLWLTASYWGDAPAAAAGAVWSVGRILYMTGYARDPKARGPGFAIQALTTLGLLIASLAGVGLQLYQTYAP